MWHAGRMANSPSGDSVTERIVRILETFSADRTLQTVADIGRRSGLPSSTAHRQVEALVGAGLLERDDDARVRLGMRLWELALRGSAALRLRQAAMPFMERVQAAIREHTQLAVLEQDEALFLERLSSPDSGANITRIADRHRHPRGHRLDRARCDHEPAAPHVGEGAAEGGGIRDRLGREPRERAGEHPLLQLDTAVGEQHQAG